MISKPSGLSAYERELRYNVDMSERESVFAKIQHFIGQRALKKYYALYLQEELGFSRQEALLKAYPERYAKPAARRSIASWVTSDEGRKSTDLEFILSLAEKLLQKVVDGELSRQDLLRMLESNNPFREIRLKNMADAALERLIAKREEEEQKEIERMYTALKPEERPASEHSRDLFKRAMVFVQGVFEKPEGPTADEVRLQQQKRKQYLQERERMERAKTAALANSPEFLESLGAPDHFDSARQQGKREERIIATEQKKLRPRLTKEDVAPARPREKSPKELAEEKLRMLRKLKGGAGASV